MIFLTLHSCGGSMLEAIEPYEVFGPFDSMLDTKAVRTYLYSSLEEILPNDVYANLFINIIDIPASGNYTHQAYIDEMKQLWEGDEL